MILENWKDYRLVDLLGKKGYIRGPFGSSLKRPEMKKTGIPVYEQQHAIYNTRDFRFFIDELKFKELSRYQVQTNDLIISCSGTLGRVSIINEYDPKGIISQALLLLRPDINIVKAKYLQYLFSSPLGQNQLVQASYGSAQQNIASRKIVENITVSLPIIDVQERIISILSSLDDKIELNLDMSKNLEAVSQSIFKEWFLDYRFPENNGELVNGLPSGWRKGYLSDILDLQYGKALKSENRKSGSYPVIGSNGAVGVHDTFLVKGPGIVIGRKGTIGKVIWIDNNFFPIDTTFFIKDLLGAPSLYYHYFLLQSQSFQKISSDSAVPGLNKNEALRNKAIVPNVEIVNRYNELVRPLFEKMRLLSIENKTLSELLDLLLPKLLTGKIKVA